MNLKILRQIIRMSRYLFYGIFVQCLLAGLLIAKDTEGQHKSLSEVYVTLHTDNASLNDVFKEIERQTSFDFNFHRREIHGKTFTIRVDNGPLIDVLTEIAKQEKLHFKRIDANINVKSVPQTDAEVTDTTETNQQFMLSGKVTSSDGGEALPGVSILIKGTSTGTTTNIDGNYTLNASEGDILQFSFIGYETQEVVVRNQTNIDIVLKPDLEQLEEVVVVGYGTQKKDDLTGAVSSVGSEELSQQKTASIEQSLQGRAAGVQITQSSAAPGGGSSIRIRGGNSIVGGSEPLFVIDGFPVYNSAPGNSGNPLATLDQSTIVSVEILKDASATAIYGSRGANGVVIITTKRGQSGKGKVDFEHYYGIQSVQNKIDLLSPEEFATYANEAQQALGNSPLYPDLGNLPARTDWQDEVLRTAPISNTSLTFSGGNDKTKYAVNGSYFSQDGIIINSGFERGSFRVNLDQVINESIEVKTSLSTSRAKSSRGNTHSTSLESTIQSALAAAPTLPIRQPDGSFTRLNQGYAPADAISSPIALAEDAKIDQSITRILGNTSVIYSFLDNFRLTTRLGVDYQNIVDEQYFDRTINQGGGGGNASNSSLEVRNYLTDVLLNYDKLFEDHNFSGLLGFSWQTEITDGFTAGSSGFVSDELQDNDLSAGSNASVPSSTNNEWDLISYFARANYTYKGRYLFTFTGRVDGSSRFGADNKWAFFPSGSFAWRVSSEPFMQDLEAIENLKLRVSYGLSGNQEIGSYNSLGRIQTASYLSGSDDGLVTGLAPSNLANPELQWETTSQFNLGVDVGLLKGRFNLVIDYYQKRTEDLLVNIPLAASSGFTSSLSNIGEMENRGIEFSGNAKVIDSKLEWDIGFNISANRNEVTKLSNRGEFLGAALGNPLAASVNLVRVGEPLGVFFGWQTEDLLSENGEIILQDVDGDENINFDADDRTVIGDPNPNFIYGFNTTLRYKRIDLGIFLQGVQGADVFNFNRVYLANPDGRYNQLSEVNNRWTTENPNRNASIPRIGSFNGNPTDRFVEDASFLRLKNITVGYNFNTDNVSFLSKARIYFSAQNLFTITDYTGYDPEVNTFGGGTDLRIGVDAGAYPSARTFLGGFQLSF